MFWKNAAWSWDDAAGDDDDDGGYLLAADLRRTPDSTPDSDLNHIVDAAASTGASTASLTKSTSKSATSTSGPKDLISSLHSEVTSYSSHAATLYTNTNQQYAAQDGSAIQRMEVSQRTCTHAAKHAPGGGGGAMFTATTSPSVPEGKTKDNQEVGWSPENNCNFSLVYLFDSV